MDRRAAVAGSWYPDTAAELRRALDAHLAAVGERTDGNDSENAELVGLMAPHAGLMYSGDVAAHAYRLLRGRHIDVVVLVGPSHYVAFEGVSVWPRGAFESPLGRLLVDEQLVDEMLASQSLVHDRPSAHAREHSLELQLPFVAHLAPAARILPLVMGKQTRATAYALADALARVLTNRRALLVASSDLSHFYDAARASELDASVLREIDRFDADGLMRLLERRPDHACGGGPLVSVLEASRALGASRSEVLRYADSGDVSGDKSSVVGYMSAALWRD
ncbi:MAG: AmmeMemoRadiSam system protein B [Vicinamibacterales bacterium]